MFAGEGNGYETSVNVMKGVFLLGVVSVVGIASAIGAWCDCGVSPQNLAVGWTGGGRTAADTTAIALRSFPCCMKRRTVLVQSHTW